MVKLARRSQVQRREETRRAILDAAGELIADRGYHGASMDEIAARAGYTRGALHYNFESKQDLLRDLIAERTAARGSAIVGVEPRDVVAALPFDREASLLFLEFAAAAARDAETARALRESLANGREQNIAAIEGVLEQAGIAVGSAAEVGAITGAFVNGLAIEALAGTDLDALQARFAAFMELMLAGLNVRRQDAT